MLYVEEESRGKFIEYEMQGISITVTTKIVMTRIKRKIKLYKENSKKNSMLLCRW